MSADMVVFGEDWGRYPTSTQYLVSALAERRRILWVNSVGLRRPRLHDGRRVLEKARTLRANRCEQVANGPLRRPTKVMSAPAVPLPGNPLARRANAWLWQRSVGKEAQALGFDRPVLWLSLPTALDAAKVIPHRALVYYCGDDFGTLGGVDHAPVMAMERELAARADLVLASHPRLAARFDPSRTMLVPHGVDLARFRDAPGTTDEGAPVAGFVGGLTEHVDYQAIAAAAKALPHWRFVLAGPIQPSGRAGIAELAKLKNIELPGVVAPSEVPSLLKRWTVALLPYRDTPHIRSVDPLKLREYLASGVPIAAFKIDGLRAYEGVISCCDAETLAHAIVHAADDTPEKRAARIAAVADADWSARAGEIDRVLERLA